MSAMFAGMESAAADSEAGAAADSEAGAAVDSEAGAAVDSEAGAAVNPEAGAAGAEADALLSRLRVIEDQPFDTRAEAFTRLHDELRQQLEGGDQPA